MDSKVLDLTLLKKALSSLKELDKEKFSTAIRDAAIKRFDIHLN